MRALSGTGEWKKARQSKVSQPQSTTKPKGQGWHWKESIFWQAVSIVRTDLSQFFNKKWACINPNIQTRKPQLIWSFTAWTGTPGKLNGWGNLQCHFPGLQYKALAVTSLFCTKTEYLKGWWLKATPPNQKRIRCKVHIQTATWGEHYRSSPLSLHNLLLVHREEISINMVKTYY